jgi:hypothetical protein
MPALGYTDYGMMIEELFRCIDELGLEVDLECEDNIGMVALQLAMQVANVTAVKLLLEKGAKVPVPVGAQMRCKTVLMEPLVESNDSDVSACLAAVLDAVLLRGSRGVRNEGRPAAGG